MPFKSEQQSKWAFATNQPFAKEYAGKTDYNKIPEKVRKKKAIENNLQQGNKNATNA